MHYDDISSPFVNLRLFFELFCFPHTSLAFLDGRVYTIEELLPDNLFNIVVKKGMFKTDPKNPQAIGKNDLNRSTKP